MVSYPVMLQKMEDVQKTRNNLYMTLNGVVIQDSILWVAEMLGTGEGAITWIPEISQKAKYPMHKLFIEFFALMRLAYLMD